MIQTQHPASFINATKEGNTEHLYEVVHQHKKTGRKYAGAIGATRELTDEQAKERAAAHWPGWIIVSIRAVNSIKDIQATADKLLKEQGEGIPLDELTDGDANAIMSRPELADPNYDPEDGDKT